MRNLNELEKKDTALVEDVRGAWERELEKKEREYDGLVSMRAKSLIDEEKFMKLSTPVRAEMEAAKERLAGVPGRGNSDPSAVFSFADGLSEVFLGDDYDAKRCAISELCQNLTLGDKKLSISLTKPLQIFANGLAAARAENSMFEPRFSGADKDETDTFMSVRPTLLRMLRDVRIAS